jgi:hypothetical protein
MSVSTRDNKYHTYADYLMPGLTGSLMRVWAPKEANCLRFMWPAVTPDSRGDQACCSMISATASG